MAPTKTGSKPLPAYTEIDIAVVGYGPVGMIAAISLAQQGLSALVVEKQPERYAFSRAGHIDGETMRQFQNMGLVDEIELISRGARSFEMLDTKFRPMANIAMHDTTSGFRSSSLLHQPELEEILNAKIEELGVEVFMATEAVALDIKPDHVVLTCQPRSDKSQGDQAELPQSTIKCKYLIGADGANSFIRGAMGSAVHDLGFPKLENLVVDFEHFNPDADYPMLQENYIYMDTRRPQGAGRWGGGRWSRTEFMRTPGETLDHLNSDEMIFSIMSKWGITEKDARIDRRAVYAFSSTLATKWRVGRVFLVGDSCHTTPPFLGQGMCSGIRDSRNLAWKLAAVMKGQADESLLDTYEAERKPHVDEVIRMALKIGSLIVVTNPIIGIIRDIALKLGFKPAMPVMPRIKGPLVRNIDSPRAAEKDGMISMQARVAVGRKVGKLDDFYPAGWKMISRHPVNITAFTDQQKAIIKATDLKFIHVTRGSVEGAAIDLDGDFDLWYRAQKAKGFLQRPDNYIFGVHKTMDDVPALIDDLGAALKAAGWLGI
ncbi:hypothetical protein ABW19_dt0203760 [Dactylella cylindrospora]|nr:hypothetical protein ABW19_dt0203760 [Dactylella cylindrospora]